MLSIRELIYSPDCGIKIDMRDRSVWQRGPAAPAFLVEPYGNVGRRVTTPPGTVESSSLASISEREGNSSTRLCLPAFFTSYIYAIFISAKFSVRSPSDIISTQRGRRQNFLIRLKLAKYIHIHI